VVGKQLNEVPYCFPLAKEYNAEARSWREACLTEFGLIVESFDTRSTENDTEEGRQRFYNLSLSEMLVTRTNEEGIILKLAPNDINDKKVSKSELRDQLEKAILLARPPLFEAENFPFGPGSAPRTGDDTIALLQGVLLPPSHCGFLYPSLGDAHPLFGILMPICSDKSTVIAPWLEFVSKRYSLCQFHFQSRCAGDFYSMTACEHTSLSICRGLEFSVGRHQALIEESDLPQCGFACELPVLFNRSSHPVHFGGAEAAILEVEGASSQHCTIL